MSGSGPDKETARTDCTSEALQAGVKGGAWGLAVAGLLVGLANQFLPAFRSSLGVSGKTALVVTPAFGLYFLDSELAMHECTRRRGMAKLQRKVEPSDDNIIPKRGG